MLAIFDRTTLRDMRDQGVGLGWAAQRKIDKLIAIEIFIFEIKNKAPKAFARHVADFRTSVGRIAVHARSANQIFNRTFGARMETRLSD